MCHLPSMRYGELKFSGGKKGIPNPFKVFQRWMIRTSWLWQGERQTQSHIVLYSLITSRDINCLPGSDLTSFQLLGKKKTLEEEDVLFFFSNFLFILNCVYVYMLVCGFAQVSAEYMEDRQRSQISWSWCYRLLWAAWHGFWKPT